MKRDSLVPCLLSSMEVVVRVGLLEWGRLLWGWPPRQPPGCVFPSIGSGPRPGEQALTHISTGPRRKVGLQRGWSQDVQPQGHGAASVCSEFPGWQVGP